MRSQIDRVEAGSVTEDSISVPHRATTCNSEPQLPRQPDGHVTHSKEGAVQTLSVSLSILPVGCFSVPELSNQLCTDTLAQTRRQNGIHVKEMCDLTVSYVWQWKHGNGLFAVCLQENNRHYLSRLLWFKQTAARCFSVKQYAAVCACVYSGVELHLLHETCWLIVNMILKWLVNCPCREFVCVFIVFECLVSNSRIKGIR